MTSLRTPGSRAILIGAGRYSSGRLAYVPAVEDTVTGLRDALRSQCGMARENITTLSDWGDPREVKATLEREARATEGVLLVYYAGHGLPGEHGELYLAVGNTDPENLEDTAVSFGSVFRRLAKSPARGFITILDCCFSSRALTPGGASDRGLTVPQGAEGGFILASAAREEHAIALPAERYTAFTGELLTYLKDGDPSGGPDLTPGGAVRYLERALEARRLPRPRLMSAGDPDRIALAENPAYQPSQAGPSAQTMVASGPLTREFSQAPVPGTDPGETRDNTVELVKATPAENPRPPKPPEPAPVPSRGFRLPSEDAAPPVVPELPGPPQQVPADTPVAKEDPERPGRDRRYAIIGVVAALAVLALILALVLPGHKPGPSPNPKPTSGPTAVACPTGTLTLVGSTAFATIARAVAGAYEKKCSGVHITVSALDSAQGFSKLVGSAPSAANSMIAMFDGTDTASPQSVTASPVGATIFAVVANVKGFHQSDVSVQQLNQIFVHGQPGVVAVGRLRGSGSRKALLSGTLHVPNSRDVPVASPACPPPSGMACTEDYTSQVLKAVNANSNEVGYAGYQEFSDHSAQYPNLEILRIGGTGPSPQGVEEGTYGFWAVEHLYTTKHPSAVTKGFLAYLKQNLATTQRDGFVGCKYLPPGPDNDCSS